ncbi:Putative adhesin [Paenibacillus catalpae]|uniref:Putative adhesin n=1 Tax=Paenibacillus catalpae TaxID=1045775 RepID=A0A1I2GF28_9BACL|nr:Putative adhesin [Paenibacillus catalpae]
MAIGIIAIFQYQFGGVKSKEYTHTLKLDDNMQELSIESDSLGLEVNFVPSTDGSNSIHVEGKAKPEVIDQIKNARVENGKLDLRMKEKWRMNFFDFSGWNDKQLVTVSLTDEAMSSLESFKLDSDSGSVRVNGAKAVNSSVATESGSIRLGSFEGDKLSLKSDSGSIKLDSFTGSSLALSSESGSIHAGTVVAELRASSDSGSITIDRLNGKSVVKSDSGSIRIMKEDTAGADVNSDSGSVKIDLPASYGGMYDLDSDSGSIHKPEQKGTSNEVIKVRTDSGSIRISQP